MTVTVNAAGAGSELASRFLVIDQRELKRGRRRAHEHRRSAVHQGRARLVGRAALALRVHRLYLEGIRRAVRQGRHRVAGRVRLFGRSPRCPARPRTHRSSSRRYWCEVTARPPSWADAVHRSVTDLSPGVAPRFVGASGAVAGVSFVTGWSAKDTAGLLASFRSRVGHGHRVRHRHRVADPNRRGEGQEHLRTVQRNPGHPPGGAVDGGRERRRRRRRAHGEVLVVDQRELKRGRRRAHEHRRGAVHQGRGVQQGRARLVGRAALALRVPAPGPRRCTPCRSSGRHRVAGRVRPARRRALRDVLPRPEPSGCLLSVLVRGHRAPAVVGGRRPPQRHRPVAGSRLEARRGVRRRRRGKFVTGCW